jgi:O-antigen ligase
MAYAALLTYILIIFIRPMEWVGALYGLPILDAVVGVAILAWICTSEDRKWKFNDAPHNWLMVGLFVAVQMSHVRHTYLAAFIASFQEFGKLVIIYLLISSLANSTRRIRQIIFLMVVGCVFMSIHGILQAHTGSGFGGWKPMLDDGYVRVRAMGFFHDPNDLALMLVAVLPFLLATVLNPQAKGQYRVGSVLAGIPIIYCIFLTHSRGGWVSLAVMIASFAGVRLMSRGKSQAAVMLALVLCLVAVVVAPGRMGNYSPGGNSSRGRWAAWGYGLNMLKSNPVFGSGYSRYTEFSDDSRVAHNSFVHCYGELGLFGYFFWFGLIFACLYDGYVLMTRYPHGPDGENNEFGELARSLVPALLAFLAAAFFLSRTYVYPLYIFFGLFAALRTVYAHSDYQLDGLFDREKHWRLVLGAEVGSIIVIYLFTRIMWVF